MNISRLPEPALIRGFLVTITGVAAYILGHNISTDWVEAVLTLYGWATPLIAGAVIRPAVVPLAKLVKPAAPVGGEGDSSAGMATD